jgi:uncharacterized protein YodC (DUF2158 family)
MKFKVGDTVRVRNDDETFKIVKIAKAGEVVEGPWSHGATDFALIETSYILEDEEAIYCFASVKEEDELELVSKETLKEELVAQLEEARETAKNLEEKLKEFTKFKVGDVVKYKNGENAYKVLQIAEAGEVVEGAWHSNKKSQSLEMLCKSYILESHSGLLYREDVDEEDFLELIPEEELKNKAKEKIENLGKELQTLTNLYMDDKYYEVLYKGV